MANRIKKMRRLSLYFRDGTAFPIILEPEDTLIFGTLEFQIKGKRGDQPMMRGIERAAVAHWLLIGFEEEEKELAVRKPEQIEYGDLDLKG